MGLIKNPVQHSSHVGLCMAMYGYVGLFMAVYGFVALCRAVYGYVGLTSFVFFLFVNFSPALYYLNAWNRLNCCPQYRSFLSRLQELFITKRAVAWVPSST